MPHQDMTNTQTGSWRAELLEILPIGLDYWIVEDITTFISNERKLLLEEVNREVIGNDEPVNYLYSGEFATQQDHDRYYRNLDREQQREALTKLQEKE